MVICPECNSDMVSLMDSNFIRRYKLMCADCLQVQTIHLPQYIPNTQVLRYKKRIGIVFNKNSEDWYNEHVTNKGNVPDRKRWTN